VEPEWSEDTQAASAIELLPVDGINLETYIERLENSLIMQALERTGNNKNQAAKLLGLNRTTLVERIKKRKLVALNLPSKEL
jgi:DNA-binding NtrC family response regulator